MTKRGLRRIRRQVLRQDVPFREFDELPRQAAVMGRQSIPDARQGTRQESESRCVFGQWAVFFVSLHFSPRGEAKCVRGPSKRGARRSARATRPVTLFSRHGLNASCPGATAIPPAWVFGSRITRHETRPFFESRLFPWLVWCLLVLKPFSLVFSAPVCLASGEKSRF